MAETKYIVLAGPQDRPETVTVGNLEKDSGQSQISGETVQVMNKRQDVGLPNRTEAWGQRVIDGRASKEGLIDVRDPRYKGDIKWLPWQHKDGVLIVARYLKGYNTLDMQYQDLVLNAKATISEDNEASGDAFYLRLVSGDNYFDPEGDRLLVDMLRIHYLNGDSVSKDPQQQNAMFWEKKEKKEDRDVVGAMESKKAALDLVTEANKDNSGRKLKNLYGILKGYVAEGVNDDSLYPYMLNLADTDSKNLYDGYRNYIKNVSNIIVKAESYKLFDLSTDGVIVCGDKKPEVVAEGIPATGRKMIDWLLENATDDISVDAVILISTICDTLK